MVQYAVLWFDVPMEHAPLVEVHHSQQCLGEVVTGQGLWETAHSGRRGREAWQGVWQEGRSIIVKLLVAYLLCPQSGSL